jgi:hypothetical protein
MSIFVGFKSQPAGVQRPEVVGIEFSPSCRSLKERQSSSLYRTQLADLNASRNYSNSTTSIHLAWRHPYSYILFELYIRHFLLMCKLFLYIPCYNPARRVDLAMRCLKSRRPRETGSFSQVEK